MKFKRKLCKPCAEAMKQSGYSIQSIGERSQKIDCWKCKRRRFGETYITEKIKRKEV